MRLVLACCLVVACGTSDTTAPAPPIVDPIASPIPITTLDVSGTAEFSSIVTVDGGVGSATAIADPYTARWFAKVQLGTGTNQLSFTATDEAGNTSDPTVIDVTQGPLGTVAPFTLVLRLEQPSAFVGVPLGFSVLAVDARGNPADQSTLAITSSDSGAVVSLLDSAITFATAGNPAHSVTATLFGGTPDEVSSTVSLFVSPITTSPPSVSITSPAANAVFADDFTVTVTASDSEGLSQIFLQAVGAADTFQQQLVPLDPATGKPPLAATATFVVPVGGGAFGTVTLVAQATDVFGNSMTSAAVAVLADPAAGLITGTGVTVITAAIRGQLRRPQGIAVDAANKIFVTNNDNNFPLVVKVDPAVALPGNQSVLVIAQPGRDGEDLVFAPGATDRFFITTSNIDRIARVDANGANLILGWSVNVGARPAGLVVESPTSIAAIYDDRVVRRFNSTAAGPNTASSSSLDASANLADAWGLEILDFGCRANQFKCGNGNCISNAQLCDGNNTCGDNTDEGATCAGASFKCKAGGVVSTAATNVCSGLAQCADGSDEAGCSRYVATDAGANDEAFSFYDAGNTNPTAFDLRLNDTLAEPRGIARSPTGAFVYIASRGGNAIFQVNAASLLTRNPCVGGCPAVVSGFDEVWGLAFDGAGDLLATDRGTNTVYRIQGLP